MSKTEYRIVQIRYGSGDLRYRIERSLARGGKWQDLPEVFGMAFHYRSLRKAKRVVAKLYGNQVLEERVVWP